MWLSSRKHVVKQSLIYSLRITKVSKFCWSNLNGEREREDTKLYTILHNEQYQTWELWSRQRYYTDFDWTSVGNDIDFCWIQCIVSCAAVSRNADEVGTVANKSTHDGGQKYTLRRIKVWSSERGNLGLMIHFSLWNTTGSVPVCTR